eukprot:3369398-Pleurochrysis_carterae.AAC.3
MPEADADGVAETGAAAAELAGVVVDCDCERVWRVVTRRFEGAIEPWMANTGLRGDGESKVVTSSSAEQAAKWLRRQAKPVGGAEKSPMREKRRNRNHLKGYTAEGRGRGRRLEVAWPSGVRVARAHVRRGGRVAVLEESRVK